MNFEALRENLHYSIISGKFYWIKPKSSIKVGDVAGSLRKDGYIQIKINGKVYFAHRLAWLYVTGKWPENEIDHKNSAPGENYWLNLREATSSQNNCNKSAPSTNTSGYKGVVWHEAAQKWMAQIMVNKKNKYLGLFDDIEIAYDARLKAEKELHGDFAKT